MQIKDKLIIDSIRNFEQHPSFQILYDFEDDLANALNTGINCIKQNKYKIGKVLYKSLPFNNYSIKNDAYFHFSILMTPDYHRLYLNKHQTIPYVIDYWKKHDEVFERYFVHFPLVYISGLEVFEYLKTKKTKVNIKHLPLSVSDKYMDNFNQENPPKKYDLINIGRKNKQLEEYLKMYLSKYPDTDYVYREFEQGENIYFSTKSGRIGKLELREDLLHILSQAKIALLSSPGLDGGEVRTGGFNPVTPRVFEAALGKCFMTGRYLKNNEFHAFGLNELVYLPNTYQQFEDYINEKKTITFDKSSEYQTFLQNNLNSLRIKQIMQDLTQL